MKRAVLAAGCVLVLTGCVSMQRPGGMPALTESDIISTPLVPVACVGAMKGMPIYSWPSREAFVLGYTGAQVASTGQTWQRFTHILFRREQPGWVLSEALEPFARTDFPSVRCSIAGIRTDGGPVFLYH